jgi:hypothetical protein
MAHPMLSNNAPPARSATPPSRVGSAKRNVVPFRRAERRSESEEAASSLPDSQRSEPVPIQRPARISSTRDSFGDSVASLSGSGRLRRPSRPSSESGFTPSVRKTGFCADLVLESRAAPPPAPAPASQGLLSRQFSSETLPQPGAPQHSELKVRGRARCSVLYKGGAAAAQHRRAECAGRGLRRGSCKSAWRSRHPRRPQTRPCSCAGCRRGPRPCVHWSCSTRAVTAELVHVCHECWLSVPSNLKVTCTVSPPRQCRPAGGPPWSGRSSADGERCRAGAVPRLPAGGREAGVQRCVRRVPGPFPADWRVGAGACGPLRAPGAVRSARFRCGTAWREGGASVPGLAACAPELPAPCRLTWCTPRRRTRAVWRARWRTWAWTPRAWRRGCCATSWRRR